MKNKFDLSMLENADKDTIEELSEKYIAVSDEHAEQIFRRIMDNDTKKNDGELHVRGVEIYHRPVWQKVLAAASAFILVAGAVTGGAFLMKNLGTAPSDGFTDTTQESTADEQGTEISSEGEEDAEPATEETSGESIVTEDDFAELQLHEEPSYAVTYDEAKKIIDEHSIDIPWDERYKYRVDVKHYADLLTSDGYDLNSLEAKSYIYHMMLNSFLYFDSVTGTVTWYREDYSESTSVTDFQVDLTAQEGHSKEYDPSDNLRREFYFYDDKELSKYIPDKIYKEYTASKCEMIRLAEDNYRFVQLNSPDWGFNQSVTSSFLFADYREKDMLFPETLAFSLLNDFDKWEIYDVAEIEGRTVAEIFVNNNDECVFMLCVDVYTGIIIGYKEVENGSITDLHFINDLQIDVPVERVEFDPEDFTKVDMFDWEK